MPTFKTTRRVRHSAADMFHLVGDIETYPSFLPLCQSLQVRRRIRLDDGREQLLADMRIGYKAIRESFTSRVTLDEAKLEIMVEYVDGPFRHMENVWRFQDRPAGGEEAESTVEFFIDYEFKSRMFGVLMGSVFDGAFRRFAEAFEVRADRVYPRRQRLRPA